MRDEHSFYIKRGERIREARKELGLSQAALGESVNLSQSAIGHLEKAIRRDTPKIHEIADALGVTVEWLETGKGNKYQTNVTPLSNKSNNDPVPVISWVAAGSFASIELVPDDELLKWVPCPVPHSKNTFALKVVGVSMENPNGKPSFEDGDIIYVDPERCPENKSFVIVTLEGSSQATFKQLIIELDGKYIQPLNPNWHEKIIKINGNAIINGVVIGKWTDI